MRVRSSVGTCAQAKNCIRAITYNMEALRGRRKRRFGTKTQELLESEANTDVLCLWSVVYINVHTYICTYIHVFCTPMCMHIARSYAKLSKLRQLQLTCRRSRPLSVAGVLPSDSCYRAQVTIRASLSSYSKLLCHDSYHQSLCRLALENLRILMGLPSTVGVQGNTVSRLLKCIRPTCPKVLLVYGFALQRSYHTTGLSRSQLKQDMTSCP